SDGETMPQESKTTSPPVAVVSGGSSGIGKAFVAGLRARGYAVVTCGRDPEKLRRLEAEFPGVEGHAVDVSDGAAMRAFSTVVLAAHPRIDLLISNAGGLREIDFTSENLQSLDLTAEIRSNLDGAIHLISGFLPGLKRRAGVDRHRQFRLRTCARDPGADLFGVQGRAAQSEQVAQASVGAPEHHGDRGRPAPRRPKDAGQG